MTEPTDEMIREAEQAYGGNVEGDLAGAIAAVLAIVERDHDIEVSKLHGALTLAGKSRELWKQRALDLGYGGQP